LSLPPPVGMLRPMNPWALIREAGRVARDRWRTMLLAVAVLALGVALLVPHDVAWHRWLCEHRHEPWIGLARRLSYWGDLLGTLIVCGVIWLVGWWRQRSRWRVAVVAAVLAACCAGLEVVSLRFVLGRPRPSTRVADGLRGPSLDWRYASFPSGHSSVAFGTAGALLVALPPVGVPVLIGAGGVSWSRVYNGAHYPSDVWAGAWFGLLNGFVFGAAARRLLRPVKQP